MLASRIEGPFVKHGYAGYWYASSNIGCMATLTHPDCKLENIVANGEFMLATAVFGASNALRERAWDPVGRTFGALVVRTETYAQATTTMDTGALRLGLPKQDARWFVHTVNWDRT